MLKLKNGSPATNGDTVTETHVLKYIDPIPNKRTGDYTMHCAPKGKPHCNPNLRYFRTPGQLMSLARVEMLSSVQALFGAVRLGRGQIEITIVHEACLQGEPSTDGNRVYTKDWWKTNEVTLSYPEEIDKFIAEQLSTAGIKSEQVNISDLFEKAKQRRALNAAVRSGEMTEEEAFDEPAFSKTDPTENEKTAKK